jgi:hypothetical protein
MRLRIALLILAMTTPVYAQTMGSTSGAASSVDINSPSSTTNRLITTPTVAAPGLAAAGVETCLGSAAGGLSLMGEGFTFGNTKVDEGCTIRLLARQLYAFGFQKAAVALMCEDEHVVLAMAEVGSPCPDRPVEVSDVAPKPNQGPVQQFTQKLLRTSIQERAEQPEQEPIQESAERREAPFRLAFMTVKPFSQEESTWFDRASNTN